MSISEVPVHYKGAISSDPDTAEGPLSAEDRVGIPYAMEGSDFVPKERYYDRDFYELEKKHLWTKTWQMAARVEEIPNTGDYTEYEIAGNSLLIIRQADGGVKALHNACRHRATELASGCGRLPGGQIVCPFHGWRWNLDGSSSFMFMEDTFGPAARQPADLPLREARVEIWANMIWINMDLDARPLSEYLAPVQGLLDGVGVGNMHPKWWKQVVLKANWKMGQEAFFEAYHVMQTHPQIMMGGGIEAGEAFSRMVEYSVFKGGHARFQSEASENAEYLELSDEEAAVSADIFIASQRMLAEGMDAQYLERDVQVFEGIRNKVQPGDFRPFHERAYEALFDYAEGAGIPMIDRDSESIRLWGGDLVLFPNYLMLPALGNCLVYRIRPYNDDPEMCVFDVWSLTSFPAGQEPERSELLGVFDKDDVENWGLIPRQDFSNIEAQQRGLHSNSYEASRLSQVYEKSIANSHHEIDRYIARGLAQQS